MDGHCLKVLYVRAGNKPSSVFRIGHPLRNNDHSSEGIGCPIPLATDPEARTGCPQTLPYLVLLRVGFTYLPQLPRELVRSYRTFSPLPSEIGVAANSQGGIFSVALSFALPRLRVTEHPALWSSDFPLASSKEIEGASDRLACSDICRIYTITTQQPQDTTCFSGRSLSFFPKNNSLTIRAKL
jgi:hypothetical protein